MTVTKGRIDREARVVFRDASMSVWEEGSGEAFEKGFKRDVFKRIVQKLNKLGWKCVVPQDMVTQYSLSFARNHRYCTKGDLKADLGAGGRHIEFKMFQNANAPDRPDHEGRYQQDKEKHMPYLMWLEMERTRRSIRDYLCNVFTGYEFSTKRIDGRSNKCGPGHMTAMEWLAGCYETSWHFKGDTTTYKIDLRNSLSADKLTIEHGERVWFADRKGRICTGIAYYNINNMWWIITGKYGHANICCMDIFTSCPGNVRTKRNSRFRERRLKQLLGESVKAMNFERSIVLRDLLNLPGGDRDE